MDGSERHLKLTVQYDGTEFHGWQRQLELRTAQGLLEEACSQLFGRSVEVAGASRTDRGVHAEGQVASLACVHPVPTDRVGRALNGLLSSDLQIVHVEPVGADFHARFSAFGKLYRYVVDCREVARVFRRRYAYHHPRRLDVDAMAKASECFVGEHDFAAFQCATDQQPSTTVRYIDAVSVDTHDDFVEVNVWGRSFLYKMVRTMVGTLLEVGRGAWAPERGAAAWETVDRRAAGPTAPPEGLCLGRVFYAEEEMASARAAWEAQNVR